MSKPVCSGNASKCNVCNVSSASQFVKPLNLSKRVRFSNTTKRDVCNTSRGSQVCSSNATEPNICKVISVSQLAKPSIASKPVCSNNVTKCNVHKNSRISQLVKTYKATKSVCFSNVSNYVICISTCNLVSNFVSGCQSVKPVFKLFDVNRKRPHEWLEWMILQNHLLPWISWQCPYIFMN